MELPADQNSNIRRPVISNISTPRVGGPVPFLAPVLLLPTTEDGQNIERPGGGEHGAVSTIEQLIERMNVIQQQLEERNRTEVEWQRRFQEMKNDFRDTITAMKDSMQRCEWDLFQQVEKWMLHAGIERSRVEIGLPIELRVDGPSSTQDDSIDGT